MPADLSPHAKLLLDYAAQAAKQRHHATVEPLHVALAMLQRDRERAEREWGPLVPEVEAAAGRLTGGAGTPVVAGATTDMLSRVKDKGDEWEVVRDELPAMVGAPGGGVPHITVGHYEGVSDAAPLPFPGDERPPDAPTA